MRRRTQYHAKIEWHYRRLGNRLTNKKLQLHEEQAMEVKIAGRFRISRKLGSGSFGDIYLGTNLETGEEVAIKLEMVKAKVPQLMWESKALQSLAGGVGIPKVFWSGRDGEFIVMVMELLGQTLEDVFTLCSKKLSVKTVLMLADQLLSRIELIHAKNLIYRDIKPENFMLGKHTKDAQQVFVIDFGLAKRYRDTKSGNHIPYKENKSFVGTVRYASLNTHMGREQSRRDDIESIGYMLVYFLRGSLPWMGAKAINKKEKYEKIKEIKMGTSLADLCKDLPEEFAGLIQYARQLKFDEKPDYSWLKGQFRNAFNRLGYTMDFNYDWSKISSATTDSDPVLKDFKKQTTDAYLAQDAQEEEVKHSSDASK